MGADALADRRVDRVLGDVAADAEVVVVARLALQPAALRLHLVRGLPGADDDLAHPAHRLAVGRHHADRADVVQDVLGRDRLLADAAFGEGDVLGDPRVEMVADHQHVEMLVHGVHRVGHGRVGAAGQEIRLAHHAQDVRRMAAAGAFGVEGLQRAAGDGGDGALDEAALVQRVRVDRHLHVQRIGDAQAGVDRLRRGAPILVQLQAAGAGKDHLLDPRRQGDVALAEEAEIHRQAFGRLQHARHVPGARRDGGRQRAMRGAGAAAEHRRHAGGQRFVDLLRADEVDMHVEPAGRQDPPLAGDHLRPRTDDDGDTRLRIRVAGLADAGDAAVAQTDIGLDDAPVVDDQCVGDDGVYRPRSAGDLGLPHAVADHLAAAEFHLLPIGGEVALDLDDQVGIGQSHAVAGGRAVHSGIGGAGDPRGHQTGPSVSPRKPCTIRAPA